MRNRQGNLFLFCCLFLLLVGCLHLDKLPAEQGEVPSPSSGASIEPTPIPLPAEQGEVPSPSLGASIEPTPIPSPTPVPRTITKAELSTFSGSGVKGFKDGTAQEAMFENPLWLVKDLEGNLYVVDSDFGSDITRLRKIDLEGNVVSIAGSDTKIPIPALSSPFGSPVDMDFSPDNSLILTGGVSLAKLLLDPYHVENVLLIPYGSFREPQENTTQIRAPIPDSVIPYPGISIRNLTVDKKGHLLINHELHNDKLSGRRDIEHVLIIELSPTYQFLSKIKPRQIGFIRNIFVNQKNERFILADSKDIATFYQLDSNGIASPIKVLNSAEPAKYRGDSLAFGHLFTVTSEIAIDQYDQIYFIYNGWCSGKGGTIIKGSWQERNGETGLYFTPIIACPDMAKLFDIPPLISEESYGGEVGPLDIAVDPQGENLYFSDAVSHTIKRIHLSYE